MKPRLSRCAPIFVVCGLLFAVLSPAQAVPILQEDFNDGVIDSNKWHQYGSPSSYVYADPPALGGGSLDNNGDNAYASGIVSKDTFTLMPNMSISFSSYLHAVDSGAPNPNCHNDVWLTAAPLVEFGDTSSGAEISPWIRHHGGAYDADPGSDWGKTQYFNGQPMEDGVNRFPATFEEWVDFEMHTLPDGSVNFYRNGFHVETADSDPGFLDDYYGTEVRLVLSGKTYQTVHLLDNVVVTPEPATFSLLLFGGIVALRRRR